MATTTVRVTENNFAEATKTSLSQLTKRQFELQKNLASGQTIHTPSNDPDGTGYVMLEQSFARSVNQYSKNASRALTALEIGADGVRQFNDSIELATAAASRIENELGKEAFDSVYVQTNQILEQILSISNQNYMGEYLYAGTKNNAPPFEVTRDVDGNIDSITFVGNTDTAEFSISESAKVNPYIEGTVAVDMLQAMNDLMGLRDAAKVKDPAAALIAERSLVDSAGKVINAVSELGAKIAFVESAQSMNDFALIRSERNISKAASTDFTRTIADLKQLETAYAAASYIYARIFNQDSLIDFLR